MASSVLHEGEPVVDEALVSRLLRHQFPEFADLALRPAPTSGSGNRIFRLGDEFSVRLPRHPRAAEHIGKENTWLPRLAEQLSLQVPRPFRVGAAADGFPWPWAIHRWIDASVAVPERLDLKRAARELAQFIGQLRRVDARGGPPASRGRPLCSRDVDTRSAIEQLAGTIDTAAARDVWVRALRAPLWSGPPRWLHADLHAANLLVRDDRIIAVIDFGSCGVGDPACDLMVAWTLLDPPARAAFRDAVGADEDLWVRGRGWALTFGLVALPYYRASYPELAAISLRTIDAVLCDHAAAQ